MTDKPDPTFYERSNAVISLCNEQLNAASADRVAASAAYAAAQYSVWATGQKAMSGKELDGVRKVAIDTFVDGYRQMLEYHFDDYVKNYGQHFGSHPATLTRPSR